MKIAVKKFNNSTRCKPGDIAVIIESGELVSVIRRYEVGERVSGTTWVGPDEPAWVVESLGSPIQNYGYETDLPWGKLMVVVRADARLRPLRNERGDDEMLRITGKPKGADKPVQVNKSERPIATAKDAPREGAISREARSR